MLYPTVLNDLKGPVARQNFMQDVLSRATKPSSTHVVVAYLLHKNLIKTVLTTNFDSLLDEALKQFRQRVVEIVPEITEELTTTREHVQVAYLHGKALYYRQRHIESELRETIPNLASFLEQSLIRGALVVVGYRGGDETPMHVLLDVLRRRKRGPGRGLFWVTLENNPEKLSAHAKELLTLEDTFWVPGVCSDDFMQMICLDTLGPLPKGVYGELPEGLTTPAASFVKRARALMEIGKTREAIEECCKARRYDPNYVQLYIEWARALRFDNQLEEAIKILQRAANKDPMAAQVFHLWGCILEQQQLTAEAIEKFRKAVCLDDSNPYTFHHLATLLESNGQADDAREARDKAEELRTRSAIASWRRPR
jgi:tetratricopeptide (TPR) repeat protein